MQVLKCGHCGTFNVVGICIKCGRAFVITKTRVDKGTRQYEDIPLSELPNSNIQPCDLCLSKQNNELMIECINKGLQQRTCPKCNTEFLSACGIEYGDKDMFDKSQNTEFYRVPFGSCCDDLKRCMEQPNSIFFVEDNGTFFMSIGHIKTNEGVGWFDHAVFFCPFCGKQIQDKKEIADKAKKAKSE